MSQYATRLATYDDLVALPEGIRAEVVAGEVIVSPSPTPAHQSVVAELYAELRAPFQRGRGGPGGWWLIPDVDGGFGPHGAARLPPFDAVELELDAIFPPLVSQQ